MNVDKEEVGRRIRGIRERLNYSMNDFSILIDSKKSTVNSWERGLAIPKEDMLKKISLLGRISSDELLYGDPKQYVKGLLDIHFPNVQLTDKQYKKLMNEMIQDDFSYHDDLKLISLIGNYIDNLDIEVEPIFYLETNMSHTYISMSRYEKQIEYFLSIDVDRNTVHIMPFTFEPFDLNVFVDLITKDKLIVEAFNEHLPDINVNMKKTITLITYDLNNGNMLRTKFFYFNQSSGIYEGISEHTEIEEYFGSTLALNLLFEKEILKEIWYQQVGASYLGKIPTNTKKYLSSTGAV